jgi:hypothetical protein
MIVKNCRPMTPRIVNLDRRAYGDADPAGFEARVISRYHTAFIPWLEGWIGVAANPKPALELNGCATEQVTMKSVQPRETLSQIL